MRYLTLLLLATCWLAACGSSRTATTDQQKYDRVEANKRNNNNTVEVDATTGIDLTSFLRRIPGMMVRGNGPTATVRVRDHRSAQGDSSPLFVVNGTILGNDFSALYSTIDPNEIARVRVLKTASETNRYGLQGGRGVVEIKLK